MSAEANQSDPVREKGTDYQAPEIEEVIRREDVEREVAYAGVIGGSQQLN